MMSMQTTDNLSNVQSLTASSLSKKITEYSEWREAVITTIDEYTGWLSQLDSIDTLQELRLYDIKELLKQDKLVMAFLAEFSRGKTETINALFFSDFNQRLLPSAPGRTTMCPTEIFWDEREEPCIKLLPIETRRDDDSLTYLKSTPAVWNKVRLDLSSPDAMKEALTALIQNKEVSLETAKSLGFWNTEDANMAQLLTEKGAVEIPVWRHAIVNYPHPLLKKGLVVIDTPGLNTMGAEPELTLSVIPKAHAVLFLTATDTGITKSDMQIWSEYVKKRAAHKLVILNKIDILWDGLESEAEIGALIQKQIQNTAKELGLDARNIFAISAQKALVAKIRKDPVLLARSAIGKLEDALANQLVKSKHEILGSILIAECANMMRTSRKVLHMRLDSTKSQLSELQGIQSQNKERSKQILATVVAERKRYEASVLTFNQGTEKIKRLSDKLLRRLSLGYLNTTLEQTKHDMGSSWTTISLNKSIRSLTKLSIKLAEDIKLEADAIKEHADDLYHLFWSKHSFEKSEAVELDMSGFITKMQSLAKITDAFCTAPINVLTEKHFLIRKFYLGLGVQIQSNFEQAHLNCNHWLNTVISELKTQINSHKDSLDKRAESLMESHNNSEKLHKNLEQAEKEFTSLQQQSSQLDAILLKLVQCEKFDSENQDSAALSVPQQPEISFEAPDVFAESTSEPSYFPTLN